jgi:hypothetical protein
MSLARYDLPDATLRPWMVAAVARDQVNVDVKDALSRGCAHIHTGVVTVGLEFFLNGLLLGHQ